MKKRKFVKIIIIIAIFLGGVILGNTLANSNIFKSQEESTTTKITNVEVGTQTIEKTLTSSGEIITSSTEKLSLTTTKYFKEMCVEEDDIVSEGDNILEYTDGTYLTAPYDCLIDSYSVPTTGKICTSSNYIQVQNMKTLQMQISISESDINSVEKGQEVKITLSASEDKTYTGTIKTIDNAGTYANSGTTFTTIVEFENDGNAKIGMSAVATISIEKAENCIAVPIATVQTENDKKYVIVVKDDDSTENVYIETGLENDAYVEIKSGLSEGQTVMMK